MPPSRHAVEADADACVGGVADDKMLAPEVAPATTTEETSIEEPPEFYPVTTLPNEIVSEIFTHFLPPYPACPPLTGILSPTVLTQICRKWREVAITNPRLWRAIKLSGRSEPMPFERQKQIADTWLRRASACPISVVIDRIDGRACPEIFVPHRARWQYLKLYLMGLPSATIEGPMPQLRHLDFAINTITPFSFLDAPLLRSVILNHIAVPRISLPWAQLTSLTLYDMFPRECMSLLRQTPNLIHFKVHLWEEGSSVNRDHLGPAITLSHLESLALHPTEDIVAGFLHALIVPALRRLHIPESFFGSEPLNSLTTFVSTSHCHLEEVRILRERTGPSGTLYRRKVSDDSFRAAFPSIGKFTFEKSDGAEANDNLPVRGFSHPVDE
ncbi:hypothetical protein DFH06DRAFT_1204431 [Mycena polygramma]|nr:hypothetical protein DFH06DRAFT_1204431 [Mycena polygramma]